MSRLFLVLLFMFVVHCVDAYGDDSCVERDYDGIRGLYFQFANCTAGAEVTFQSKKKNSVDFFSDLTLYYGNEIQLVLNEQCELGLKGYESNWDAPEIGTWTTGDGKSFPCNRTCLLYLDNGTLKTHLGDVLCEGKILVNPIDDEWVWSKIRVVNQTNFYFTVGTTVGTHYYDFTTYLPSYHYSNMCIRTNYTSDDEREFEFQNCVGDAELSFNWKKEEAVFLNIDFSKENCNFYHLVLNDDCTLTFEGVNGKGKWTDNSGVVIECKLATCDLTMSSKFIITRKSQQLCKDKMFYTPIDEQLVSTKIRLAYQTANDTLTVYTFGSEKELQVAASTQASEIRGSTTTRGEELWFGRPLVGSVRPKSELWRPVGVEVLLESTTMSSTLSTIVSTTSESTAKAIDTSITTSTSSTSSETVGSSNESSSASVSYSTGTENSTLGGTSSG